MAPTGPKKLANKLATKPLGKETAKMKPDDWTEERRKEDCLQCKFSTAELRERRVVEQAKKMAASLARQKAAHAACIAATPGCTVDVAELLLLNYVQFAPLICT
jgi:hypothetical protein